MKNKNETRAMVTQNTHLWIVPDGTHPTLRLTPGEKAEFSFVQCMDGGFSYEIWMKTEDSSNSFYSVKVDDKELYHVMRLHGAGQWQLFGNLWVAKGEHSFVIENTSDSAQTLSELLVTRNAGYIAGGHADRHAQKLREGAQIEALLKEDDLLDAASETPQKRQERLSYLYRCGFIDRMDQDVSLGNCRCGVPMGGIGAGKIELDDKGVLTAITINHNYELPIYRTDAGLFGVYAESGGRRDAAVLQTEQVSVNPLPLVERIDFTGRFPRAKLVYHRAAMPVEVELDAFSALIEGREDLSAMPAVCYTFTLRNPGEQKADAAVLFSMENLLGVGGSMQQKSNDPQNPSVEIKNTWNAGYTVHNREGNYQTRDGGNAVSFTCLSDHGNPSYAGEYYLLCDRTASVCESFDGVDMKAVWAQFEKDGSLPKSVCQADGCEKPSAAVSALVTLAPGQETQVSFVLAWYLPKYLNADGEDWGVYYTNLFHSAKEAAQFMMSHKEELFAQTMDYERELYDSDLEDYLKEKLLNDRFPLYTCSIFDKDGRFAINESPTGMGGCLGTMDQRLASHGYYTNFFPKLDETEINLFAAIQGENGSIPHDLGYERIYTTPKTGTWSDLCSSFVIQIYHHALSTGDRAFLERLYPQVKRAVFYQESIDFDGDGIPDVGAGHGTTYDTYHWYGCCSFVAGLWLAELECCVRMAKELGDAEFEERCRKSLIRSRKSMIEKLWNDSYPFGGFFMNYKDDLGGKESQNCFIAQLAGQWFASLLDLEDILPKEYIATALKTIAKRNLYCGNMRLMSDETTPQGDFAWFGYTFVQYDEAYYGCLAIANGFLEDGLEVFKRVYEITDPWNVGLTYFTDGKFSGLPYYMTNPASSFLIEALSGWFIDGLHGTLRLAPVKELQNLPIHSPVLSGALTKEKDRLCFTVLRAAGKVDKIKLPGFAHCEVNGEKAVFDGEYYRLSRSLEEKDILTAGVQ